MAIKSSCQTCRHRERQAGRYEAARISELNVHGAVQNKQKFPLALLKPKHGREAININDDKIQFRITQQSKKCSHTPPKQLARNPSSGRVAAGTPIETATRGSSRDSSRGSSSSRRVLVSIDLVWLRSCLVWPTQLGQLAPTPRASPPSAASHSSPLSTW